MDPLSLCASAITLIGLATKTVKVLNEYNMAVKGAPAEVEMLIEELKLLTRILGDIEKAYTSKATEGTGTHENNETLANTINACQKYLLETLRMLEESGMVPSAASDRATIPAKEPKNRFKYFKRMMYPLKREEIQRSLAAVRDYKASLTLALSAEDR